MENRKEILHPAAEAYILKLENQIDTLQGEYDKLDDRSQYDNPLRDALKYQQELALCLQIETTKNKKLEAENSQMYLSMLNDMCHYGELDEHIKKDMQFLYKMAAHYLKPDAPVTEGLCPTFYLTMSAEGDKKLVDELKEIKRKYELK